MTKRWKDRYGPQTTEVVTLKKRIRRSSRILEDRMYSNTLDYRDPLGPGLNYEAVRALSVVHSRDKQLDRATKGLRYHWALIVTALVMRDLIKKYIYEDMTAQYRMLVGSVHPGDPARGITDCQNP